jgi:hypothetical protein
MNNIPNYDTTPQEKFQALENMKKVLEDNFVTFAQILFEIKRSKAYKHKGYKNFKDFIEQEYNMTNAFASKLLSTYEIFIEELDIDETSVKEIGFDKLAMIKPLVKNSSYEETEEWIQKAENLNTTDLREEIKKERERKKENQKTEKDILIEQFKETMVTFFNCNFKELMFKMALYFQDQDLESVKERIKLKERQFKEKKDPEVI